VALAQSPHEIETGRLQAGLRAVENVDEAMDARANGIGGEPLDLGVDLGEGPRQTVAVPDLDRVQADGRLVHSHERGAAGDFRTLRRTR
jgi:hypothetical protein